MAVNRVMLDSDGQFRTYDEHRLAIKGNGYVSSRPHFVDQADMTKAMRDPRYQTDESYRQKVAQMINDSDAVALGLEHRSETDGGDKVEAIKDYIVQQFRDPRYAKSALYREQLKTAIANDPMVDELFVQPLHPMGGVARFQVEPEISGPMAPPPKPHYNPDSFQNTTDEAQE